jgi:hypothetical protein
VVRVMPAMTTRRGRLPAGAAGGALLADQLDRPVLQLGVEGRAMLSVLAELQRELIVASTNDGARLGPRSRPHLLPAAAASCIGPG